MHSDLTEGIEVLLDEKSCVLFQYNKMRSAAPILTHILVGVPSVCGNIDEEDTLAFVLAEVYSAIPIQNLRTVLVNGVFNG